MSCIHKVNIDLYDFEPSIKNNEEILKILNFYEKCGLVFTNEEKENVINNILSHPLLANFSDCHVPRISIKSFDKSCDLIKPYGVFGIFEHGNIDTYNLYTKILNSSEAMNKYLDIANIYSTNNDNNSNYTYRENEIAQISPLDCSQKQAISSALRKDVVIQGPPGTGKSQVIANLIANAIAMKKTVLFITEKHVASNVVYNRLAEFKCACLKIFDVTNLARKNDFYQQCQNSAIVSPPERIKYVQNNFNINPSNQIEKIFIEKNNYDKFTKDDPTQKFLTFAINNAPSYQNIVD
jgi:hypothetical protein